MGRTPQKTVGFWILRGMASIRSRNNPGSTRFSGFALLAHWSWGCTKHVVLRRISLRVR